MKLSVVIFLAVFAALYGYLHFFTASYLSEHFVTFGTAIAVVYLLGYVLSFVGYYVGSRKPKSPLYFLAWLGYIWMGSFFISLVVSTVAVLVETFSPRPLQLSEVALAVSVVLSLYSLFRGLQFPRVRIEKVKGPESLKGLRMVQITDLHVGLLNHDEQWLNRIVNRVNELQADFIFLTGDLVEGKWEYVRDQVRPLNQAKAKLGKVYISGNHELIHGGMVWEKELAEKGWRVLHNQNHIYNYNGQKVAIAGVPDRMVKRFDPRYESNPEKAMVGTEAADYKILLAHEPSSVFDVKTQKPDLLLAGHTHGGQIFPFQLLVRLVQPVVAGWKTISGIQVYAHTGTGLWGPPMRLGTRNEIIVFEFIVPS